MSRVHEHVQLWRGEGLSGSGSDGVADGGSSVTRTTRRAKVVGLAHALSRRGCDSGAIDDLSLVRKVESELFRDRTVAQGTDPHQR
jgi:hypothetical protein